MRFDRMDDIPAYWAEKTPEATAVRWPTGRLTYAELEARIADLARCLEDVGAGKGDRVGILMERSERSIIAAYAVLRTGAAYVPLDPGAPLDRLTQISQGCALSFALVDAEKSEVSAKLPVQHILDGDGQVLRSTGAPAPMKRGPWGAEDHAYILHTSGTTGVPKGIVHTHKSGLAFVRMAAALCALTAEDRVGHHTSLHFDMSLFDIFSTALVGGCTVVLPTIYTKMPASLSKLVETEQLTVWYSVPFALIQMAERGALDQRDFSRLRIVMFGGESIQPLQLKRFADHAPQATFINAYGPAEINICTANVLPYEAIDGHTPIGLGTACDGVHTLVTDTGELLVGGDQLMLGYWDNAALNGKTLRDINAGDGVTRYYTSGDIVRQGEDGDFELIGRADRQVKVRGHRVELDEVELVLSACDGVSEVIVGHLEQKGELVASVSSQPGVTLDETALRRACGQKLPPYAVPSQIVLVDEMPRTGTGKVDRLKLLERHDG